MKLDELNRELRSIGFDIYCLARISLSAAGAFFRSLLGANDPEPERQTVQEDEKVWTTTIDAAVKRARDNFGFSTTLARQPDSAEKFEHAVKRFVEIVMESHQELATKFNSTPVVYRTCLHNVVAGRIVTCNVVVLIREEDGKPVPEVVFAHGRNMESMARAMNAILN